jgi:tRNA-binding protein
MPSSPSTLALDAFLRTEVRAGTIVHAEAFPDARKAAIKLWVDLGPEHGVRTSSAQLTRRYTPDGLVGTSVLALVNVPPRRVAGFVSEVLVLGVVNPADDGDVVLVRPDARADGWPLA